MIRRFIGTTVVGVFALLGSVSRTEALPFATIGEGWDGSGLGAASLTFAFGTPTPDLPLDLQRAAIVDALDVWAAVVNVTFTETTLLGLPNSIDFNFQAGGFAPDVLAFAFFPAPPNSEPIAGDVFINDDWLWEVGDGLGFLAFDLERVALHEIGHSLGLLHSETVDAVMWPYIESRQVNIGLHSDDIAGIRSLYAAVPESSSILLLLTGLSAVTLCRTALPSTGALRGRRELPRRNRKAIKSARPQRHTCQRLNAPDNSEGRSGLGQPNGESICKPYELRRWYRVVRIAGTKFEKSKVS